MTLAPRWPGRAGHLGLDAGPAERADLDRRGDVACFQSSGTFETRVTLQGRPRLELEKLAADQPRFRISVRPPVGFVRGGLFARLVAGSARRWPVSPALQAQRDNAACWFFQPVAGQPCQRRALRLSLGLVAAWPQIAAISGNPDQLPGPVGPAHRDHPSVEFALPRRKLLAAADRIAKTGLIVRRPNCDSACPPAAMALGLLVLWFPGYSRPVRARRQAQAPQLSGRRSIQGCRREDSQAIYDLLSPDLQTARPRL